MRRFSLTRRQMLVVAHDLFATAAAVIVSFYVRFEAAGLESRIDGLIPILPGFVLYAGFIYFLFGIHEAKWRFTSLPDFGNIVRAATVLAAVDAALAAPVGRRHGGAPA